MVAIQLSWVSQRETPSCGGKAYCLSHLNLLHTSICFWLFLWGRWILLNRPELDSSSPGPGPGSYLSHFRTTIAEALTMSVILLRTSLPQNSDLQVMLSAKSLTSPIAGLPCGISALAADSDRPSGGTFLGGCTAAELASVRFVGPLASLKSVKTEHFKVVTKLNTSAAPSGRLHLQLT